MVPFESMGTFPIRLP